MPCFAFHLRGAPPKVRTEFFFSPGSATCHPAAAKMRNGRTNRESSTERLGRLAPLLIPQLLNHSDDFCRRVDAPKGDFVPFVPRRPQHDIADAKNPPPDRLVHVDR